jgi:hypothetical protein
MGAFWRDRIAIRQMTWLQAVAGRLSQDAESVLQAGGCDTGWTMWQHTTTAPCRVEGADCDLDLLKGVSEDSAPPDVAPRRWPVIPA